MMTPPADLRDRVLAAAAASPSRTRREGRRLSVLATIASVAAALVIFQVAGGVGHSSGRPASFTWVLAGGWAAFAAMLTWWTLARGGSTLPRRPLAMLGAAGFAPIACFAWMCVFAGRYVEPFERVGYRCFALTLAMGVLPLASFLFLRRGIEPRRPSALGAAAGAMSGAWAGVLVDLWCPLTNAPHSALGHVLPLALLIGAGALAGRRLLGVRAR